LVLKILNANPHAYEALVFEGPAPALARELLAGVRPEQLLASPAVSPVTASAMLAGLWLWHDGLHESHEISQTLHDKTGSFWHAILHRREGDFSNSKYWYAKAAGHPVLTRLVSQAGHLIGQQPADSLLLRIIVRGFDPNAFVDLIEEIHDKPGDTRHAVAVELQQLEWRLLFEHQ
jgi:hypothetical protein